MTSVAPLVVQRRSEVKRRPDFTGKNVRLFCRSQRSYCQHKLSQKKNGADDKAVATNYHVSASRLPLQNAKAAGVILHIRLILYVYYVDGFK
jgi:hypothetical protein